MLFEVLGESEQVSVTAVSTIIGAVFTGIGLLIGKLMEKKRQQNSVKLEQPVPEVPTRKVFHSPSWHQFEGLTRRVDHLENEFHELRDEQKQQFTQILQAGAERENRLRDKLDDVARGIHGRIDEIIKEGGKQ